MTETEREIQAFILRAINKAPGAVTDSWLRGIIKTAFRHIDFTAGDLGAHIGRAEENKFIAGTNDEAFGLMWALTPDGKIKAQLLK